MSVQVEQVDMVIVGGGMVGLMLAAALRGSGLHIVVVERAEYQPVLSMDLDCRVSAIVQGNVNIFKSVGVWKHLENHAGLMESMRIWDGQEQGGIRFESLEIGEDKLGVLVENKHLIQALQDTIHESEDIELLCPESVESVVWQRSHVEVILENGQAFHAPLIVGADGARSW
ncbi:MAG: FAD-dependent monooxygenase, partial [Ghiorsea sp.]|nr:FAD-dependent monooxygenase [Ghiorsea sp.]